MPSRVEATPRDPVTGNEAIRVLVVDDDQLQGRLIRANLERPGRFRVEVVTSAAAFDTNTSRSGSSRMMVRLSLKKCPDPVSAQPKRGVLTSSFVICVGR